MRRLRQRSLAIVAVGVLAGTFAWPSSSAQAIGSITDVGWWTRVPGASAPEGGFNVGSAPDGPNSVAAIRIDAGGGLRELIIGADEAGGAPDLASVQVCPADNLWTAEAGGALADAPSIDCANGIPFNRRPTGQWAADISSLAAGQDGTFSVGFLAAPPEGGLAVVPTEVQFDPPEVISFVAEPTTTTTTRDLVTTTTRAQVTAPPPPPPTTRIVRPTTTTTAPTTTTTTSTTTIPFADDQRALLPITGDGGTGQARGDDRPWAEAGFLVFLSAMVGVLAGGASWYASTRN